VIHPRARAGRARAMQEKIYEIPRARAARAPCAEKVSTSEMAASARTSWLSMIQKLTVFRTYNLYMDTTIDPTAA
jgi:hypothetical protein